MRTFDSDFRRDLANVLSSWITGMEGLREFGSELLCSVVESASLAKCIHYVHLNGSYGDHVLVD